MKLVDLAGVALESTAKRKWTAILVFAGLLPGLCLMYASLFLYNNSTFFYRTIRGMIAVEADRLVCIDLGSSIILDDDADEKTAEFLKELGKLSEVKSCGALFSAMASPEGLLENEKLKQVNLNSGDEALAKFPGSVKAVYADRALLEYCGISCGTEYQQAIDRGEIPVLVGAAYRNCFEQGGTFTHSDRTYRVVGFLNNGVKVFGDNGLLLSHAGYIATDYRLVMPRPEYVMAECYLHSIYCIPKDGVSTQDCISAVKLAADRLDMKVMAGSAEDKINGWSKSEDEGKREMTGLAVLMVCVSIVSQITIGLVIVLLRKKEFGVLIANGVSQREIAFSTILATTVRGVLAFLVSKWFTEKYYIRLRKAVDPSVMSTSLLQFAVLTGAVIIVIAGVLSLYLCRRLPKDFLDDEV
ncbi:MAG: ABC transporter permease [Lachnospiraceae bacterium]|nr:ABC transporter permease [Lachnospiraceae bacterium]